MKIDFKLKHHIFNSILFPFFFLNFSATVFAASENNDFKNSIKNSESKNTKAIQKIDPSVKPKIAAGEMTVYFQGEYHIFKIREFKNLSLSDNCFLLQNLNSNVEAKKKSHKKVISSTPNCKAYDIAQIKVQDVVSTVSGATNPASMHCVRMSGRNLIAFDHKNQEHDLCRFSDNSMVTSWSMFQNSYQGKQK